MLTGRGECGLFSGEEFFGVAFELFEEDAVLGDFGFDVSVGGAGDADADGAGGGVAGHADDADVVGEILAAELGADAGFGAEVVEFFFPTRVAEGAAAGAAGGGEGVVVAGGGEFDGFEVGFGAGAADDDGEMVGGACGGADVF